MGGTDDEAFADQTNATPRAAGKMEERQERIWGLLYGGFPCSVMPEKLWVGFCCLFHNHKKQKR